MPILSLDGQGPRYAQITRAVIAATQSGVLAPGARMPSSRQLATDLGIARNVVLLAYEQLLLEGYLVTRHGAGTFVSEALQMTRPNVERQAPAPPARLTLAGTRMQSASAAARQVMRPRSGLPIDFMYGVCLPDDRTLVTLRAAFAAALRRGAFGYAGPNGDETLRIALTDRLRAARGITRPHRQMVITSGAQQALDICARLLVKQGDRVVMEDPSYASARAVFEAAGARIVPVPVDADGLDVQALASLRRIRLAYVTPSHQFPTGAVLSIARRYRLLEWARANDVYVIEDDYDGEYRYSGRRIESLTALDPTGPLIYCGTLAKALFPGIRLGYLSLPENLVDAVAHGKWLTDCGSPLLIQQLVTGMLATASTSGTSAA